MANQIAEFFARIFLKNEISPELDRIIDELLSLNKTIENSKHPELLVQEKARVEDLTKAFIENGGKATELSQILTYQGAQGVSKFNTEVENLTNNSYNNFRAIGQMDRITREFAAGGLNQGLNGLTMLGNTLTRIAVQEGGFTNAINGLVTAFEGPAGLILIVSAAVGVFEQLSKSETDAEKSTADFAKMLVDTNKEIKNALNLNTTQITSMQSLMAIANDYTLTEETRAKALKEIKTQLESVNKEEAKGLKSKEDIIGASNLYVEALKSQNLAELSAKRIGELNLQLEKDRNIVKTGSKGIHLMEILGITQDDVSAAQGRIVEAEKLKRQLEDLNKSSTLQGLQNPFGTTNKNDNKSAPKNEEEKTNLDLLKAKQAFYKDDIYNFINYADQIVELERKMAVAKEQLGQNNSTTIGNINAIARQKLENNQKQLSDELAKLDEKQAKIDLKAAEEYAKEQEDIQVNFAEDNIRRIEDNLKLEEELANKDYEKKKVALQKAMDDIAEIMNTVQDSKAVEIYTKALNKLQQTEKINNAKETNKKINDQDEQYKKLAHTLAKDVTDGLVNVWDSIQKGQSPLEAIGNAFAKMAEQIAAAIIEALIFKAILDAFPELKGVFATIGAVSGIGGGVTAYSGKQAAGGITNGASFAMVGEAGPEAIMPLSKLNSMMSSTFSAGAISGNSSGNGSQFVLRGQDLLLSVNRAQKASNLKGQNISLA